jgi:crotonobetainyl-CoA:carnitine CoA-transferase CaiB-like acyl-CoA transferase
VPDAPRPAALAGFRVVELGGQVAAAYATKLLAGLGASVLKVEPPGGDPLRVWGPFRDDLVDVELGGGVFRYLNAGKECRAVAFDDPEQLDALLQDVARADVVVESLGAGSLERHRLGPERLAAVNPALGLVRISDFGQHGPHVGMPTSQLVLQAMGGWVSAHGVPGTDPVQVGGRLSEYTVGAFAACAALTAARAARRAGTTAVADLSTMECLLGTLPYPMLFAETLAELGLPRPEARYFPLPGIVRCRDGWVGINALTGQHWQDACSMLGADEWRDRQQDLAGGGPELDGFFAHVQPWLDARDAQEIVEISQAFRIPAAPVGDGRMMLEYAQFRERPFFVEDPDTGATMPGAPYRLSATPCIESLTESAAESFTESLGESAVESFTESLGESAVESARGRDREDSLPFEGLRVVDLGTFWAGPYATMYLGALGADVVKVESIQRPDGFRFAGAFPQLGDDWYDRSGVWQATNCDKHDVTLDLGQEQGRALLRKLLAGADVVLENFSARVVEQFGLGYEELHALNPSIVMVRMPGFGLEGPWRDYVGWAMVIEQATGMASVTGWPELPLSPGGFLDPAIGMHAATAIQAALAHRERTGEGQLIEVAQLETGACLTAELVIEWSLNGRARGREGNRHRVIAPQGVYRCLRADGVDGWVAISARDDAQWRALAETVGAGELRDLTLDERHAQHDELDERISAWTATHADTDVVARLRPHRIAVAPVLTVPDMYGEPQLESRGYYQPLENAKTGTRRYPGWPMQLTVGNRRVPHHRSGPPTLGGDNDEILWRRLGVDVAALEQLRADQVIGDRMPSR